MNTFFLIIKKNIFLKSKNLTTVHKFIKFLKSQKILFFFKKIKLFWKKKKNFWPKKNLKKYAIFLVMPFEEISIRPERAPAQLDMNFWWIYHKCLEQEDKLGSCIYFFFLLLDEMEELVGGGFVINRANPIQFSQYAAINRGLLTVVACYACYKDTTVGWLLFVH